MSRVNGLISSIKKRSVGLKSKPQFDVVWNKNTAIEKDESEELDKDLPSNKKARAGRAQ